VIIAIFLLSSFAFAATSFVAAYYLDTDTEPNRPLGGLLIITFTIAFWSGMVLLFRALL
jgi:hypothetical protein